MKQQEQNKVLQAVIQNYSEEPLTSSKTERKTVTNYLK